MNVALEIATYGKSTRPQGWACFLFSFFLKNKEMYKKQNNAQQITHPENKNNIYTWIVHKNWGNF